MSFFEQPILNSPYLVPEKHWELDGDGRPTDTVVTRRRKSDLISAMPKPKSVKGGSQSELDLSSAGLEGQDMAYNVTEFVNEMRSQVDAWRKLPNPNDWQVSPITQRLLQLSDARLFRRFGRPRRLVRKRGLDFYRHKQGTSGGPFKRLEKRIAALIFEVDAERA